MKEEKESLMEFPCAFALKVMVVSEAGINEAILELINDHVEETLLLEHISERPSRTGKYKALTVTFTATSRKQLDNIYMELSRHDMVRMAL